MAKKSETLQEKMTNLEVLADKVENGDVSINDIIDVYKESITLIKSLKKELSILENKIVTIENDS